MVDDGLILVTGAAGQTGSVGRTVTGLLLDRGLPVPEMEKAWRTALSSAAKQIEIDMKEVTAVDNDGRQLLESMHRDGARLLAQGVEMTALVEEITGRRPPAAEGRPRTGRGRCREQQIG